MANGETVWAARRLLRGARQGVLATVHEGQPLASLVTPGMAPDLTPLLLLSGLSPHTRHLRADPRCSLMVAGAPLDANPQTAPRVSLLASARPEPDAALKARWLALHPYAALYAGFADFTLWRLEITGAHWVGGFAQAARFTPRDLIPAPAAVEAVAAAAADIIAHCNGGHADAMAAIAGMASAHMVAVDVDGCDLAEGERVVRVAWDEPVADAGGVRAQLVRLAAAAREAATRASS